MKPGDPDKTTLRYIRIANEFRRRIAGGEFVQGQRLPPQHQLAQSFGVAFNTLRQALDLLEREGFVVRKPGSGTFVAVPPKTKGTILVVDDEEAIRQLFVRSIPDEWDVEAVGSGAEALKRMEKRTYALIFLDLLMPGMTGAETFTAMRERKFDFPVVIITGYPDSSLMAQLLEAGPVAMLRKPFTQQDIHETIQRFVQPQTRPSVAVR